MPWRRDTCPIWSTLLSCIPCIRSGLSVDLAVAPVYQSACLFSWLCVISLIACTHCECLPDCLSVCLSVCLYLGRLVYCLLLFWLHYLSQKTEGSLQTKQARNHFCAVHSETKPGPLKRARMRVYHLMLCCSFDAAGGASAEANNIAVSQLAGLDPSDVIMGEWSNSVMRPCHYVAADPANQCIVLAIR